MMPSRAQGEVGETLRSSRERCIAQHGLLPGTGHPVLRLQRAQVAERRERFFDLAGGLGPELDRASVVPDKGRYCLLISDADSIVVEACIPDGYEADFDRHGIALGGVWDERVAGTNGIDMALRTDRVLTVRGRDHFHTCFHGFACSSAPLHDAQDNLLGSITLVGLATRHTAQAAWCEQVLKATAGRFQAQLFRRFHGSRITARLISYSPDRLRRFETMVACDDDGIILSSVPLWRDGAPPKAHRQLAGQHLSELRELSVSVRGPAMVLPRRLVSVSGRVQTVAPRRAHPDAALATLATHGGGLGVIVERARKLATNRVPLLICGEAGVDKEGFIRALLRDMVPNAVSATMLDAARPPSAEDFAETLGQVRFLSEYPVGTLPPVLVVLNADRLGPVHQSALKNFLEEVEQGTHGAQQIAARPLLIFSIGCGWRALRDAGVVDPALLFLMGQAIVELPPLRARDVGKALVHLLATTFGNALDLSEAARKVLLAYDWPGNLREARAVLREAAICGNGHRINLVDLPQRLLATRAEAGAANRRHALIDALDSTGWNVTRAATLLGKSRATINRWIAADGLHRPG